MPGKISDRSKKIFISIAIFFIAYTLAGFFILPYALKGILVRKLSQNLHREVTIEALKFNPYSFSVTVKGFNLKNSTGPQIFISFDELYINLQGRSILRRAVVVKELKLTRPAVNIIRNNDLSYNFSDLMPKGISGEKNQAGSALKYSVNNIQILDGSVDFDDRPKKVKHQVREILAAIPFISNLPREVDVFVKPTFSAKINGSDFKINGEFKPFSDTLETVFNVNIQDLSIPYYLAYSPVRLDYELTSGYFSSNIVLSYKLYANREPSLTLRGSIDLKKIGIQDLKGNPMVNLPLLHADIASAELFSRKIDLSAVVLQKPHVYLLRDREGILNLRSLIPAAGPKKTAAPAPALILNIDKVQFEQAGFTFSDLFNNKDFHLTVEPVDCAISGFSASEGKTSGLHLSFKNLAGESALIDGSFSINPVFSDLKLDIKDIDMAHLQPYAGDMVNIIITKGRASASGRLKASGSDNGIKASYEGNALLTGFSTLDKLNNEVLIKLGSLSLNGMNIGYNPVYVNLRRIVLNNFYSDVIVDHEGRLNLKEIMVRTAAAPPAKAPVPSTESAGPNIRVDDIIFKRGLIRFTDRHIDPDFTADLTELGGKVTGISSMKTRAADVDLAGKIDQYAPIEITGKINPLKKDLYAALRVSLNNFELGSLTPYSGKYIGYKIEKGKLFLDLKYNIDKRKLDALNKVLIDQIDLGDRVESPDAAKLPVGLAISLLKDRQGKIDLDLPVSGTLDDPQFSIWGVIKQIVFNLVTKAATSPFALLGELFGGGADLGYVEFDPGSHVIADKNMKKLDALINALFNRPALKLDIEGYVDAKEDSESLRDLMFARSIKAQKFNEMVKKGDQVATIDDVLIGPQEYEQYLWMAYKNGKFSKPTNILGFTKKLPVPEMENLLRENTAVTDDDLRALASERTKTVRDYILKSGKVEPDRVFIVSPESLSPEKKENLKNSRVDFKLK